MTPGPSRTVWSSEQGDMRKQPASAGNVQSLPPGQQTIYLHRETKGRGGKGVTLLRGFVLSDADLASLCKTLKQACGTGGTVKDAVIEIQGDQREKIASILSKMGYKCRIAGG